MPDIIGFKPEISSLTITDKWLLARTNEFIRNANTYMDSYQAYSLVKEFEVFVDEVSNWYIRINRRRFWKTTDLEDKRIAYWCLYNSIVATVKVMAPIIPFMTEKIWQNMVRNFDKNAVLSVHLNDYPAVFEGFDNEDILKQTKIVRDIIALALRLRNEQQIKLRQPLSKMYVLVKDDIVKTINSMSTIVRDELNIKNIEFLDNSGELDESYLIVNFKTAGAVLKKDVQKLKIALEGLANEEMALSVKDYEDDNLVKIPGWEKGLKSNLFVKESRPKKGIVVGKDGDYLLALDVTLNEGLINEGAMRDIIRQCQLIRKEADFKVEQRIKLGLFTDDAQLNNVIKLYTDHIKEETLANELIKIVEQPEIQKNIEILGKNIKVTMVSL